MASDRWKVLLIDDEEGIRRVMSLTLKDAGYEVLTAADGERGLEICLREQPELVITDIRMPGLDGLQVLGKIKARQPDTEIIVMTAYGDMDLAVRALQLDASDFITKPIQDEALFIALERAIGRARNRKALQAYTALLEEKWMHTAEELARTFRFQARLIESSIDGILGCDARGRILVFNPSLGRMLGYTPQEARQNLTLEDLFPPGGAAKLKADLAAETHGGPNRLMLYETHLQNRTGALLPVQISATALAGQDQEPGIVLFFRDLRELRRLEQRYADQARLLQQDKMISLGRLAASVVHEINNPLAGILNYVRLMGKILRRDQLRPGQIEKFQGYIDLVESELSRCSQIVSNLLAFSRKSKMERSPIDINELLRRCVLLSRHKMTLQGIQVRTQLAPHLPPVPGDFNQIQQCVINLIFNAVDAMPQGGILTLASAFDARQGLVEIRVADTGCGISQEDLPRIFDPFFTTKVEGKGLGLGLSTVYGIVDRHRGTVDVRTDTGRGTVFLIRLPVDAQR